jgi:oligopeptide transport system permease protein
VLLKFLLNKSLSIFITFIVIISVSFALLRTLPGSPFDEGKFSSPEIEAKMQAKYGLDKPIQEQYFSYIKGIFFKGDLGPSLKYPNRDVNEILFEALPVSLQLGLLAFLVSIFIGMSLGIIAAQTRFKLIENIINQISTFGISMPSFIFAAILIYVLGLQLKILPVALWEGPRYLIMPVLTLSIAPTAYIIRITKSAFKKNQDQVFIRMAQAKGISYFDVLLKHILLNSLIPIITVIGPLFAILITGSFVVEYIFALPGIGKYFVTAFINRDYFLVSGVIVIFSSILLFANTVVDLLIIMIDPKQRPN